MSIQAAMNLLGKTVMPKVAASAFPDTLTVVADTRTQDSGGAVKTSTSNAYTSIPCAYAPRTVERRLEHGGKVVSIQEYLLTMPTHTAAEVRINLNPANHRLVVAARGNEPVKTFRILAVGDQSGVVFEVVCEREN